MLKEILGLNRGLYFGELGDGQGGGESVSLVLRQLVQFDPVYLVLVLFAVLVAVLDVEGVGQQGLFGLVLYLDVQHQFFPHVHLSELLLHLAKKYEPGIGLLCTGSVATAPARKICYVTVKLVPCLLTSSAGAGLFGNSLIII